MGANVQSLRGRVLEWVRGQARPVTVAEATAVLGSEVTAATAATAGRYDHRQKSRRNERRGWGLRPWTMEAMLRRGRRRAVGEAMRRLWHEGKLRRVGPATYQAVED